ncbi:magnesium dechelatase SGRL, chloroplastic-like isoform X2 [Wolffia australiana]
MASSPAANAVAGGASCSGAGRFPRWKSAADASSSRYNVVSSSDRRDSPRGSLVLKATKLLGPPTRFEASKLEVVFLGEETGKHKPCTISRTYTLRHCDLTANLTLAVSNYISFDQLRSWQARLQSDDVVAEWKMVKDERSLHVHCYVSGANPLQDLAAEFRYHIFCKELPLVLKAVVHGDSLLFEEHPELMEASVWVYFHSSTKKFNRVECWGPLKAAMEKKKWNQKEDQGLLV